MRVSSDGKALLFLEPKPCFMCGDPTIRLDICFEAPFCDTFYCNDLIRRDLEMLNSPQDFD